MELRRAAMFDIIGKRKWFFAISITIMVIGIIGYFVFDGFKLDIQFQGGTIFEIEMQDDNFDEERAEEIVRETLGKIATGMKSRALSAGNSGEDIHLLTLNIADPLTSEEQDKLMEALRKEFNISDDAQMNISNVEPTIGGEQLRKGIQAIFITLFLIICYIAVRFRVMHGWSSGLIAVVALLHDVMVMLIVYIIFRIPLNDSFVAGILTILGYSLNDTVIIYDRIRENTKLMHKVSYKELVNTSIVQTLSRTLNTTAITLMSVIVLFVFSVYYGIESITEFAFPLMMGIISGTYSSICICGPLWVMWRELQQRKLAKKASKA